MSPFHKDEIDELDGYNEEHPDHPQDYTKQKEWNDKYPSAPIYNHHHPFFPVSWNYTPPVEGGSFDITLEMALKYPFLFEFAEKKVKTAMLLRVLKRQKKLQVDVAPMACEEEMNRHAIAAANFFWGKLDSQATNPEMTDREHLLFAIMQLNKFTMVCHPVGYHEDHFGSGGASLENKMCFIVPRKQGIGRGGNIYHYTWALLDWKNTVTGLRRRLYLQMEPQDNQRRIYERYWREYLSANNNQELRRFVGMFPLHRGEAVVPEQLRQLSQNIPAQAAPPP